MASISSMPTIIPSPATKYTVTTTDSALRIAPQSIVVTTIVMSGFRQSSQRFAATHHDFGDNKVIRMEYAKTIKISSKTYEELNAFAGLLSSRMKR